MVFGSYIYFFYSYRQAQATVLQALPLLNKHGILTKRPEDYFAEMAKSDQHMQKVSGFHSERGTFFGSKNTISTFRYIVPSSDQEKADLKADDHGEVWEGKEAARTKEIW